MSSDYACRKHVLALSAFVRLGFRPWPAHVGVLAEVHSIPGTACAAFRELFRNSFLALPSRPSVLVSFSDYTLGLHRCVSTRGGLSLSLPRLVGGRCRPAYAISNTHLLQAPASLGQPTSEYSPKCTAYLAPLVWRPASCSGILHHSWHYPSRPSVLVRFSDYTSGLHRCITTRV